ncbi:MAG: molybdopterin-dependent oxidoreductase [Lacisediminihabitans sp.]
MSPGQSSTPSRGPGPAGHSGQFEHVNGPAASATTHSRSSRWWWVAAGISAVAAGLGGAELAAALLAPSGSPLLVVGSLVIDIVPAWVKNGVIALFGTSDKAVLLIALALLVAALAGLAGILERARPPLGRVLLGVIGLIGVVAAVTRSSAGQLDAVPSLVATVIAAIILRWLSKRLAFVADEHDAIERRRFLVSAGSTAVIGLLAVLSGRMLTAGRQATQAARTAFKLPRAATIASAPASGTSLAVHGLTPLVTPNADFYRIDTALQVPTVDPKDWSLKIFGMVDTELTITFDELVALPLEESYTTLACVSNYVGGDLIGNAKWLGYPIRELLKRAGPRPGADMVLSTSIDGFTASTPLPVLTDDRNAILALGMNGEPLRFEHGYPVRMVVPGLYGYVSATKWVTQMEVTTFAKHAAYWTDRGWSERGPVKLSSRIDVPHRGGGQIAAGTVTVAGVAWAQHTGISGVQLRVDDGPWNDAELADAISADTWRQWHWSWLARPGKYVLSVRAIDAGGEVQTAALADVVPDGATGLHSIDVTVS